MHLPSPLLTDFIQFDWFFFFPGSLSLFLIGAGPFWLAGDGAR